MSNRILITSGPTREYLDPVRFLSNGSSGRMGAELARAVLENGDSAIIVSGPVDVEYPEAARVHRVVTTDEMLEISLALLPECNGVIAAAAPCDFRPLEIAAHKLSKSDLRDENNSGEMTRLVLELSETPDIIAELSAKKTGQWTVAFALETQNHRKHALGKLRRKGCDLIVLNDRKAIHSTENTVEILTPEGTILGAKSGGKREVAKFIYETIITALGRK